MDAIEDHWPSNKTTPQPLGVPGEGKFDWNKHVEAAIEKKKSDDNPFRPLGTHTKGAYSFDENFKKAKKAIENIKNKQEVVDPSKCPCTHPFIRGDVN